MVRIPDSLRSDAETAIGIGTGDLLNDQFEVGELLGKGGMGAVYQARDTLLDRPVAIKVLPAFLGASARAREGLRKEAARAIELSHPGLARTYYFGVHADQPFLVMEFIPGTTLSTRLDAGPLGLEAALTMLAPLAAAVDYAHGQRLVHRDIKPSNILVREGTDQAVLIDFGIAGEARDQATRSGHTDQAGTTGTLSYMSPEQVRGKPPQPSMDLYALAAVAYEMLSGDPPFFRGDPLNVQYQIIHETPPPVPGQPEAVQAALLRGLAKAPDERFPSAAALVAALGGAPLPADRAADTYVPVPEAPTDKEAAGVTVVAAVAKTTLPPAPHGPSASTVRAAEVAASRESTRLLVAAFLGFGDGGLVALMGFALWGGTVLPWAAGDGAVFAEVLQNDWWYLLATALPLVLLASTAFALLNGLFVRWLEAKLPRTGAPFLFGTASGYFLGGYATCFLVKEPSAQIGAAVAAFCGMFVVAGGGIAFLSEAHSEGPRPPTWWGWRLGLTVALPVAVGLTGYVVGSMQVLPPYCLLYDSLAPRYSNMAYGLVGFHYLWWGIVVIPILAVVTQAAAPLLDRHFPGTGRPVVLGMAISLVMPLVVNYGLDWFVNPSAELMGLYRSMVETTYGTSGDYLPLDMDLGFFFLATILISTTGPITVAWTARDSLFPDGVPLWLYGLAAVSYRTISDLSVIVFALDYVGVIRGVWLLHRFESAREYPWVLVALVPMVVILALGITAALSVLLVHESPTSTRDARRWILAASQLVTPALLAALWHSHSVQDLDWAPAWEALGLTATALALPLVPLGARVFREPLPDDDLGAGP